MLDDEDISGSPDMAYFVRRHFQRLIVALRQPESDYSPWLGDAVVFLVENIESFPQTNSYFDPHLYNEVLEWIRRPDSPQSPWVANALEHLVKHVEYFPPTGDEDAYVVEYIYPH